MQLTGETLLQFAHAGWSIAVAPCCAKLCRAHLVASRLKKRELGALVVALEWDDITRDTVLVLALDQLFRRCREMDQLMPASPQDPPDPESEPDESSL